MDLQLRILGEDQASAAFSSMASSARAGLQVLIDFTKESVKAYAESERIQRQLILVAKEHSGALQNQAVAISQVNAVSDELVMQLQTMLLRYGAAPAAVGDTTQAILDYAAATGTDARSATEALTRGVEAGTGHIKGLGVSFEATGNKSEDLRRAVAALTEKFGGAGKEDASSLIGQTRAASDAFGELQESFGGFVAELGRDTGVLESVTKLLRDLNEGFALARDFGSKGGFSALVASAKSIITGEGIESSKLQLALSTTGTISGIVGQRGADRAAAAALASATKGSGSRFTGGSAGAAAAAGDGMFGPEAPTGAQWIAMAGDAAKAEEERTKALEKAAEEQRKILHEMVRDHDKAMADVEKATKEEAKRLRERQKDFAEAGASLGAAFVNQLSGMIEQLSGGGEKDIGKVVVNILAGLLTAAGGLAGNLLLPGVGGAFGAAVGGLAGAGLKAATNVNINTFDARSTREFFESNGGRGFYNAQRTGRSQGGG